MSHATSSNIMHLWKFLLFDPPTSYFFGDLFSVKPKKPTAIAGILWHLWQAAKGTPYAPSTQALTLVEPGSVAAPKLCGKKWQVVRPQTAKGKVALHHFASFLGPQDISNFKPLIFVDPLLGVIIGEPGNLIRIS